jgi:hypothetical protein
LLHYIDLSLVGDIGGDVGVVRSLHAMTYWWSHGMPLLVVMSALLAIVLSILLWLGCTDTLFASPYQDGHGSLLYIHSLNVFLASFALLVCEWWKAVIVCAPVHYDITSLFSILVLSNL